MEIFTVRVDVALSRPPKADARWFFVLAAENAHEAQLLATQWAASHKAVSMPVASRVL